MTAPHRQQSGADALLPDPGHDGPREVGEPLAMRIDRKVVNGLLHLQKPRCHVGLHK